MSQRWRRRKRARAENRVGVGGQRHRALVEAGLEHAHHLLLMLHIIDALGAAAGGMLVSPHGKTVGLSGDRGIGRATREGAAHYFSVQGTVTTFFDSGASSVSISAGLRRASGG